MKILHISSINNKLGNGVAVAIENYLISESKYCDIAIYNLKSDILVNNIPYFNYKEYKTLNDLPNGFDKPDLIIFNEVYKKEYIKLYKECLNNNIPYIIIPHGCLVKEAQNKKRLKKFLGNILLFNRFINKASAIQFLNENEKNNTFIKYKKSIISGNGVIKKDYINKFENKDLIYIGRYDIYTKGLDILVDICFSNKEWFINNNVKIKLYGRDSNNNLEQLKQLINEKNINDILIINDAIYDKEKDDVLKKAYAFIQISRHEGQPMGIMEALMIGLPVLASKGTSFKDFINQNKCGIGVDLEKNEIMEAIKSIYSNEELRNIYSKNAIDCMNKYYDFDKISLECIKIYEDIIRR